MKLKISYMLIRTLSNMAAREHAAANSFLYLCMFSIVFACVFACSVSMLDFNIVYNHMDLLNISFPAGNDCL